MGKERCKEREWEWIGACEGGGDWCGRPPLGWTSHPLFIIFKESLAWGERKGEKIGGIKRK